jgi:hemoglobin/transferrin/lactoferrin receptor protein
MKKIIFFLFATCVFANIKAQTVTVRDGLTHEPVPYAAITSRLPAPNIRIMGVSTNLLGQADLSIFNNPDSIYVRHSTYGLQGFTFAEIREDSFQIFLQPRTLMLNEVVFSASKSSEARTDVPYSITVVDNKQVAFSNPQTSADMLANTGEVFVQKSQGGGGSPVLRGFEANKVLLVVDGVRMNNAIYRAGHVQDAITVDPNMLDRTEVLFGPSSVIYGSDALGGTVHFYSRKPILSSDTGMYVSSNAVMRYASANAELTAHFNINIGTKKFASLTSVTRSDFGDLRMGARTNPFFGDFGWCRYYVQNINGTDSVFVNADPLLQRRSGYSQMDIMQKFLISPGGRATHLINFQYSTSSDIPRYDRLAQISNGLPVYAEWNYGPQKRILGSYTLSIAGDSGLYDQATIIAAFQKIDQDRITRKLNSGKRKIQEEDVMVYSLNADFKKIFHEKHELRFGLEGTYNDVQSTGTFVKIASGDESPADTRYPDGGSTMLTASAYFAHSWEISDKFILSEGIRLSYTQLHADFLFLGITPLPYNSVSQSNIAPSGSIGFVWKPVSTLRLYGNGSTGFRAPNVDDMGKFFESTTGKVVVPNDKLKPEMAFGTEGGFEWTFSEGVRFDMTGFYTQLKNAIVVKEFTYNGSDSILYDSVMTRVYAAQNVDEAWIYGFTMRLTGDFNRHFSAYGTVTYTYGRYRDVENDTVVALDHIPPVFGQAGLIYRTKGLEAEFFTRFNGWKRLADYSPSGEDNLDQATPYGMPAWTTINFRAEYHLNKFVGVNFAVENIMDVNYRYFASGISAPGRNVIFGIRVHY